MLVIKINEKEYNSYPYSPASWPSNKTTIETQHALDNYIQGYGITRGAIVCLAYTNKPIDSYAQLFVITEVKDKIEQYTSRFEKAEPLSCLKIRQLGHYQGQPKELYDDGWTRWESPKQCLLLTEDERKEWINDSLQAKLKEWGYTS